MPTYVALRALNRSSRVRVPGVTALATPGTVTATGSNTGGSLATGTYYVKVTAVGDFGETTPSAEANSGARTGPNASVALSWAAVPGATKYRVYVGTAAGAETGYFETTTNSFTLTTLTGLTTASVPARNTATAKAGEKALTVTTDTIVNVDDIATRRALNNHRSIGQYVVTAVNNRLSTGTVLTANS